MYLTAVGNKPNTLVTTLSPLPTMPGVLVRSAAPRYSPWRVIMIGRTAGALIESNLILNLSEPCALTDTSWITGRSPGTGGGRQPALDCFGAGMNTQTMNYFTQLLRTWAGNGPRHRHWYGLENLNQTSPIRSDVDISPSFAMPEIAT
jgi:hypothetical protein